MTRLPYRTAHAFRAALRDRFATIARADPRFGVDALQRQFAYDRLLARAFSSKDADRWVLKGAGALLARLEIARHSQDIDMLYGAPARAGDVAGDTLDASIEEAVHALRQVAAADLLDHFRFEITRTSPLQEEARGRRIDVTAYLGTRYASFHVDVVVATVMTGRPDLAAPLTPLDIQGLRRPSYRVFPMADHIADKVRAMLETHAGADRSTRASTRVKDLVDLALILSSQPVHGLDLRVALTAGAAFRGLTLPERFTVPDLPAWRRGYPRKAAEAGRTVPDFDDAVRLATAFLDPVLRLADVQTWDPVRGRWTGPGASAIS